jgi:hypothetical protein
MDTSHDGRWLQLPQAAVELGVSPRTLRRRVKDGQVQARMVPSAHGPRYEVWLATAEPLEPRPSEVATHDQPDMSSLTALLEKVLANQQHWMERAIRAEERLLALEATAARQGELAEHQESGLTASTSANISTPTTPRRPWWRFWGST